MSAVDVSKFETRAFRLLAERLDNKVQDAALALAQGAARSASAEATAQEYCEKAGFIRGLQTVVGMCQDIEDEIMGKQRTS